MPKTPRDFSKGLIYSIVCKTDETLLYIGSTTNFRHRKSKHKNACTNENAKKHNLQVYVMIRANGGWDNFEIMPVKEFPCENNIQLVIEEERFRKEMNANLNKNKAYRTKEEHKEYIKKYNETHQEHRNEYAQKYRDGHKEEIKDYHQNRYAKNKDDIDEKHRIYYEANKEKKKEYEQKNREKINKRVREKRKEDKIKNLSKDLQNVA